MRKLWLTVSIMWSCTIILTIFLASEWASLANSERVLSLRKMPFRQRWWWRKIELEFPILEIHAISAQAYKHYFQFLQSKNYLTQTKNMGKEYSKFSTSSNKKRKAHSPLNSKIFLTKITLFSEEEINKTPINFYSACSPNLNYKTNKISITCLEGR